MAWEPHKYIYQSPEEAGCLSIDGLSAPPPLSHGSSLFAQLHRLKIKPLLMTSPFNTPKGFLEEEDVPEEEDNSHLEICALKSQVQSLKNEVADLNEDHDANIQELQDEVQEARHNAKRVETSKNNQITRLNKRNQKVDEEKRLETSRLAEERKSNQKLHEQQERQAARLDVRQVLLVAFWKHRYNLMLSGALEERRLQIAAVLNGLMKSQERAY